MKNLFQRLVAGAVLGALGYALTASGDGTNNVPWWDAFEAYTNGMSIAGTNGWTADTGAGGIVTTDTNVTLLLTNYYKGGTRAYPLPSATHTAVLQVASTVMNATHSATGGVVAMEFMVLPTWMTALPAVDTNMQYAVCVTTNGRVAIWHHDVTVVPATNQWLELTNSPTIGTNDWARFTILHDYTNRMFQVQVVQTNAGVPIADNAGWTAGGQVRTGTWFYMVQTNAMLSGFSMGASPAYVDDVLATNRSLAWSGTGFAESTINNGTIALPGLVVTPAYDTFAGTNNENFVVSGRATVTYVPAGLTAVVQRVSATNVVITLTGAASAHESTNSISNLAVRFGNTAFAFSNAWDVSGYQQTNLTVAFFDTPRLTFSTNRFNETAANDGSIDNSNPLVISLTNGTFNSNGNANFGTNLSLNLPAGLTGSVTVVTNTQLQVQLAGHAAAHNVADNTNVTFAFLDGAFNVVPASSVFNNNTNLAISYTDPSVLTYATNVFTETAANNGAVNGTPLTLSNKTFNATNEENLVGGKVTVANVPGGLTLVVTVTDSQHATLSFTGNAGAHAAANSIGNLTVTFNDTAFVGSNAVGVVNGARSDLSIQFLDQPVVSWQGTTFTEATANDGTIGNSNLVNLSGTTFTGVNGDNLVTAGKVTVGNVPTGLTAVVTRLGPTQAVMQLTGIAAPHRASSNTGSLTVQFLDTAFTNVAAANVTGSLKSDLSVTFNDAASLTYGVTTFTETVANDGSVSGGTITLTGDTLTGVTGDNFVTAGKVAVTNVPAGLTLVLTRSGQTTLTLSFTGYAAPHLAANSIANLAVTFGNAAFAGGNAAGVGNSARSDLAVQFLDQPAVSASGTTFTEAGLNDGTIGNTLTVTLTGTTFTAGPYTAGSQYTITNVPPGLTFVLTYVDGTHVTAALTNAATSHAAANSITNLHLAFLTGMFANVAASNVIGHPIDFAVQFADQPVLTYSGDTFREVSGGVIDNRNPVTISLAGDTFAGANGDEFVGLGRVTAGNYPAGLTPQIVRNSGAQLAVTWAGVATANSTNDNATNVTFTFKTTAFANAASNQVVNNPKTGLKILFTNDTGFFNVMPYEEPFEAYPNSTAISGTNGWVGDYTPAAGIVTTDATATSGLLAYLPGHSQFPTTGTHTQALYVQDYLTDAIHSEGAPRAYVDFMTYPAALQGDPISDTNLQYAFYVSTNSQIVAWNRSTAGGSAAWITLTNAGTIDTSRWARFTVTLDYTRNVYQLQVNETRPVTDARGWTWTDSGMNASGSWFYMVQTNGYLSGLKMAGVGNAYLDDLTVKTSLPELFGVRAGTTFKFR